jgi:hypothetical protein
VYENKRMCTTFVSVFSVCMSVCVCKIGHGRWLFSAVRPALASKVHDSVAHWLVALLLTSENLFRNLKKPSENPRRKLQREMPSFSNSLQRYAAAAAFPLLVPRIPLSSSRSRIRFGVGNKVTFGLYRCLLFALTC